MNWLKTTLFLLCLGFAFPLFAQTGCDPTANEIPNNGIDEDCDGLDDIFLTLPPYIYTVVGQEFELYFRNIILSKHPQDYQFEVLSGLSGNSTTDKWAFTPTQADLGTHGLTVRVKANNGTLLASRTTKVRISPRTFSANSGPKKLLLLGHSFYDQGYMPYYIYQHTREAGNPNITFYGSKHMWVSPNIRFEGHGGQTWRWFLENPGSPLTHGSDNHFAFTEYFDQAICPDCKPDWVVVYLDINDFCGYTPLAGTTLSSINDTIDYHWDHYATPIIDSLRKVAPNCKIALCTAPPPNARESAFLQNWPSGNSLSDRWRWQKIVSRIHFKCNERFADRENENIYLIPTHLDIDDFAEYPSDDPIHPSPDNGNVFLHCGYRELAKSIYAWIKYVQNETSIEYFRDADNDGFGRSDDKKIAPVQPIGYTPFSGDCNDNDPNINPSATEICDNNIDDDCNGEIDEDWILPVAKCAPQFKINLGVSGTKTISVSDIDNGSSDNCAILDVEISQSTFSCDATGWHFVVLKVTDASGNTAECSTIVEVIDNKAPKLTLKQNDPVQIVLNQSGNANVALEDLANVQEACPNQMFYSLDGQQFVQGNSVYVDCYTLSNAQSSSIYIKATDLAGNESDVLRVFVEVIETTPPMVQCKTQVTAFLGQNGQADLLAADLIVSKSDDCGAADFVGAANYTYDCADLGQNTLTLTVSDAAGNTASCSVQISIEDNISPTLDCRDMVVPLDTFGISTTLLANDLILSAEDNCGAIQLVSTANWVFDCDDIGHKNVVLTVIDNSGNLSNCVAALTIQDVVDSDGDGVSNCYDACPNNPDFIQPISLYVDADGDGVGGEIYHDALCFIPAGFSPLNTDCDDNNPNANPLATEVLDGVDNDCDGEIDEGLVSDFLPKKADFSLKIWPNPAESTVFVELDFQSDLISLQLFSVSGQLFSSPRFEVLKLNTLQLDLSELPNGFYLLKAIQSDGMAVWGQFLKG